MAYDKRVKELVKLRLRTHTPSNVLISIGSFGEFTRDQLIEQIDKGTPIGNATIRMDLLFIKKMASISKHISREE